MREIISIVNQKGGVGKSTTAHAIGIGLAREGYKVLFIDLDSQSNLTTTLQANTALGSIVELLTEQITTAEAIQKLEQADLIPASNALAGMDLQITDIGKEYKLKEALEPVKNDYDYCIIDTPPALNLMTVNALVSSTGVIIPAQADIYSLQGISQLYSSIKTVRQYCNSTLTIKGILLTRHNTRAVLSRDIAEVLEDTAKKLGTKLFKTAIRECISIKEAQANTQDIFTYSNKSNASADYRALIKEILQQEATE